MFETVGVMAVSACILQMVYEKIEKQRPVVDYTEENKKFLFSCSVFGFSTCENTGIYRPASQQ